MMKEENKNILVYNIENITKIMFKPHNNYNYDRSNLKIINEDAKNKIILYKSKMPFEDYDFTIPKNEMENIYRIRLEILRKK